MSGRTDRWIRRKTIGCVGVLALIAGTVSHPHMHLLLERPVAEPVACEVERPFPADGLEMLAQDRAREPADAFAAAKSASVTCVGLVATLPISACKSGGMPALLKAPARCSGDALASPSRTRSTRARCAARFLSSSDEELADKYQNVTLVDLSVVEP